MTPEERKMIRDSISNEIARIDSEIESLRIQREGLSRGLKAFEVKYNL